MSEITPAALNVPYLTLSHLRRVLRDLRVPGGIRVTVDANLESDVRDLPGFTARMLYPEEIGFAERFIFVLSFGPQTPGPYEVVVEGGDKCIRYLVGDR
jgi:hypothetical protein